MEKQLERLEIVKTFDKNIVIYSDDEIKKMIVREYQDQISLLNEKVKNLSFVIEYQDKQIENLMEDNRKKEEEAERMELAILFVIVASLIFSIIICYSYLSL